MALITDLYRQRPCHMNHTPSWRSFQALMKLPALAFCIQGELRPKLRAVQPLQVLSALTQRGFILNSSGSLNTSSALSSHLASPSTLWTPPGACPSKDSKKRSFFSQPFPTLKQPVCYCPLMDAIPPTACCLLPGSGFPVTNLKL